MRMHRGGALSSGRDSRRVQGRMRLPAWAGYPITVLLEVALTAGLVALQPILPLASYPIAYILLLMAVAYWLGEGPGVVALVLSLSAYDYFFVPPFHSVWPPAMDAAGWAKFAAFFIGAATVALAMSIIRRSQRRTLPLAIQLRGSNERQELAAQVLARLNQQTLAEDSIRGILGLIEDFVGVEAAGIRLRQTGDFTYFVSDGFSGSFLEAENLLCIDKKTGRVVLDEEGRRIPQCMCGIVLRGRTDPAYPCFTQGGSFWTNSTTELLGSGLQKHVDEPLRGRCNAEGYESLALIPLKRGDEVRGLLHIADKRPNLFTLDLIEFLEGVGASIGIALAREQAEEELRQSAERLNRTQGIAHLGSWELDLVDNRLLWSDEVYRIFGLQPQEFGATYEAFLEAVHPDDRAAVDEAYSGSLGEGRDTYENEHRVVRRSDGDIRIVHERCEHIRDESGRIIRSIGMVHDITERKRAEETIRRQLFLLQAALVPPEAATDSGYRAAAVYLPAYPGQQIGGDFYDMFKTESGQIGMVIGDVSGKGIEAASLAAAARSTVHSFAYELSSPGVALSHANAVVQSQESESGRFVTMFLAIIDPPTGALNYARAGHPPAAIWRADGSVGFLESGSPPIGILAGQQYETLEDRLGPGDKLVLYTDGILEARRGADIFDMQGIQRALTECGHRTGDQVAAGLLSAARDWAEGELRDDIAILVVERAGEEAEA